MSQSVIPLVRELVRCYQAFERVSNTHNRQSGRTPPQFNIVATLGNTSGMTFKELGGRTLITKGTLTGVVDRPEKRGIVKRIAFLAPTYEALAADGRRNLEMRLAQPRISLEKRLEPMSGDEANTA